MPRLAFPIPLLLGLMLSACAPAQPPLPDRPAMLFTRPPFEAIYCETPPLREELDGPIVIAATPGEYESASLGIFTRRELRAARINVGPLHSEDGVTIGPEAVEIRSTRYIKPYPRWTAIRKHPRPPGFLDKVDSIDLEANTSHQFWLTLRVPEDAAAGHYRGEIRFEAEKLEALSISLELTVYSFTLDEAGPDYFLAGNNLPLEEEQLRDAHLHGMNTLLINHGWAKQVVPRFEDGRFFYPPELGRLPEVVAAARRHGLGTDRPFGIGFYSHLTRSIPAALSAAGITGPGGESVRALDYNTGYEKLYRGKQRFEKVNRHKGSYFAVSHPYAAPDTPYGTLVYRGWVAAFRAFDEAALARGWGRPWFYIIDEPQHGRGSMRLAIAMLQAAHEAGVDAMVTCNEPTISEPDEDELWFPPLGPEPALRLEPWLTTRCYHNRYLGEQTLARTHTAGDIYATYINIYGNQPVSTRHLAGVLAWKLSLERIMLWQWKMAGEQTACGRSYLRDWEAVREGIDDLRYLERLERAQRETHTTPELREQARALLEEIRSSITTDLREIGYVDGVSGAWVPGRHAWSPRRYDELRARVAEMIERLLEAP